MTVQSKTAARPSSVTTGPIAGSRKIYTSPGRPARHPRAVPRDRAGSDARARNPIAPTTTSGPYTDPAVTIDLEAGLPPVRAEWIAKRGFERIAARAVKAEDNGGAVRRPAGPCLPGRASGLSAASQASSSRSIEFARAGIVTEEMIYVAHRENLGRAQGAGRRRRTSRRRRGFRRRNPRVHHAGIRPRRDRARPRHHSRQHQPSGTGAGHHRPQLPGEDQRQYRQLRRHLRRGGRGGKAGVGDPLGRRHGDGPLHRPQHPQHPRLDPAQLAGADRHRADLPGAGEGRRRTRQARLGSVQGHADRAGRAGRRLLHHPCRRAAAATCR